MKKDEDTELHTYFYMPQGLDMEFSVSAFAYKCKA